MAYKINKDGEIEISGFEQGIAVSPHKGIANIQNGNISTEVGEITVSFARFQQSQAGTTTTTGTINPSDSTHLSAILSGLGTIQGGFWITTMTSTITNLGSNTDYYILSSSGGTIQLSATYLGSPLSSLGLTGTAGFNLKVAVGQPIVGNFEKYSDGTNFQYRYYVLDKNGALWIYDTAVSTAGVSWFLPDSALISGADVNSGITILNGWVLVFAGTAISCKLTNMLGGTPGWQTFLQGHMLTGSPNPHFAFTGHQGKTYYTDGNFIGSIFPNTSLLTGIANIQSYASYTTSTTTGTISALIGGTIPFDGINVGNRIPAVFLSSGTIANALQSGGTTHMSVLFYIKWLNSGSTFEVYAAASGGSAVDITTGATGTQYFNTFSPANTSGESTLTFTPQRLNLPFFETATSIAELGDQVIIGTKSNTLYPWNQVSPLPGDLIPLPENGTVNMITVNNMVYVFAGNKGNVYVTNGSTASLVISVPDYCAGIAGTPASYIEPYFTWGGAMYLRGRVWFSILDQTASKTGNCGGVWSFVPTQNFFIGQDTGLSLRLENQSSYGTYNGVATVLLPSQQQNAIAPQYWSGWYSSISGPTYGIDFTSTTTSSVCLIETDLIPTGTLLDKRTFKQIEYKLSSPLTAGESISIKYRVNGTSVFTALTGLKTEPSTPLSGYYVPNFQISQMVQLQVTLTPATSSSGSFIRLIKLYIR